MYNSEKVKYFYERNKRDISFDLFYFCYFIFQRYFQHFLILQVHSVNRNNNIFQIEVKYCDVLYALA